MSLESAIITQARCGSSRLPQKVLLPICGKPLLAHHLARLDAARLPIIVATTTHAADDAVAAVAETCGAMVFRGDETDVLDRFYRCAEFYRIETVIRTGSDCPLIDGALIREGFDIFRAESDPALYLTNALVRSYPRGFDYEIFSFSALEDAHRNAPRGEMREHVTPYLRRNLSGRMRLSELTRSIDASHYRVVVDTESDFRNMNVLIEKYGCDTLDCEAIIAVLERHPELGGQA